MHRVTSVEALDGYRLRISFDDDLVGEVDLSDMIGHGVFAKAYVDSESHTVAWPGEIDLCPDSLHADVLSGQKAA